MSGKIGIHWMGWMWKKEKIMSLKADQFVASSFSLNGGGARAYTLWWWIWKEIWIIVYSWFFFCACTFTDSRRNSTTNFYSETRACFSPKNMKYLEIIAPDIVPVMNKGITHHQVLFTLFPSPEKNLRSTIFWMLDDFCAEKWMGYFLCVCCMWWAQFQPRLPHVICQDAATIATSFSCNMSMMIWRYVQEYANSSSLVGSLLSNQKKMREKSKRSNSIYSPCHIFSKHLSLLHCYIM